MPAAGYGVLQLSPDDSDTLDQLREALHQQERECQRDEEFGRVDGKAAGVGRLLVL
jgi:hypothetical protein